MAGEANALLNVFKLVAENAVQSGNPMNYAIGTVVSEDYRPLEIKVDAFSDVLDEDDLILTKAVQDHWLDIEVFWETVDDNDLLEFQTNHYSNIATQNSNVGIHNSNTAKYNTHTHTNGNMGSPTGTLVDDKMKMENVANEKTRHTSHLHNIQGRKKIRVYNGLHKGEIVLLLRCAGGQQYIVVDRLSPHIVGGEWRTHAGAVLEFPADMQGGMKQETLPYEVTDEKVLSGWKEGAADESKWKRFSKPPKFVPGGNPPEQ